MKRTGVRRRTNCVMQLRRSLLLLCAVTLALAAADDEFVFTSDVALVRVDAQVVDRNNRPITGLSEEDFVLRENGAAQTIRHFGTEDVPLDLLLLIDVSGSMQTHVQDLSRAAHSAFRALGEGDRVGIMVFDRGTRVRRPLGDRPGALNALDQILRQETFDGGTDVTRGLLDAAEYLRRESREDARRAIVVLTDDQTERGRDERGVLSALARGNIVLSALLAPDAMGSGSGRVGMGWPPIGSGGGLGGIILRGPRSSRFPGPVMSGRRTQSAGTASIARSSGGESLDVDESSALETTLLRLRQRYTLHFSLPDGVKAGQERDIDVELTAAAQRRYPGAEVRFRRMSQTGEPVVVSSTRGSRTPERRPEHQPDPDVASNDTAREDEVRLDPAPATQSNGGWRRAGDPEPAVAPPPVARPTPDPQEPQPASRTGGWRRAEPADIR